MKESAEELSVEVRGAILSNHQRPLRVSTRGAPLREELKSLNGGAKGCAGRGRTRKRERRPLYGNAIVRGEWSRCPSGGVSRRSGGAMRVARPMVEDLNLVAAPIVFPSRAEEFGPVCFVHDGKMHP